MPIFTHEPLNHNNQDFLKKASTLKRSFTMTCDFGLAQPLRAFERLYIQSFIYKAWAKTVV